MSGSVLQKSFQKIGVPRYAALIFLVCLLPAAFPSSGHTEQREPKKSLTSTVAQPTEKSCFIEGISAYQKKEYRKAIQKLKLLLKLYPGSPLGVLAHYMLSQTYYHSGNLNEASRQMQIILKEYPDFALKGVLNPQQLELLKNGESAVLSVPTEKSVIDLKSIVEEFDPTTSDLSDSSASVTENTTPLQNLDEILKAHPNATFNELILLRTSQLYLSAGNLPEAAHYFKRLSVESPGFPVKSFFNQDQLSRLARHYQLPAGSSTNITPGLLPAPPPLSVNRPITDGQSEAKSAPGLSVNSVIAGADYIEIMVKGGLSNYKSFLLKQPERLVIDIPGAGSTIKVKSITVNRYGIKRARIGLYPASVRIVLEAAGSRFPPNKILLTEKGIKIVFRESRHKHP